MSRRTYHHHPVAYDRLRIHIDDAVVGPRPSLLPRLLTAGLKSGVAFEQYLPEPAFTQYDIEFSRCQVRNEYQLHDEAGSAYILATLRHVV